MTAETVTIKTRDLVVLGRALAHYQQAVIADPDYAPDERHEHLAQIADASRALGELCRRERRAGQGRR